MSFKGEGNYHLHNFRNAEVVKHLGLIDYYLLKRHDFKR